MAEELCELNFENAGSLSNLYDHLMSRGEDAVLAWLKKLDRPALAGELTERLGITTGRMANILNSLEKRGYISRTRAELDKRQVYIDLTEEGKTHIEENYASHIALHKVVLEYLGDDAEAYLRMQAKLAAFADDIA